MRAISRDTTLCMSLSARPSNFGTRFHNRLYERLGLDYIYKAFTTTDLPAAIGGIRALGIRGCAISMPFKEAVIPLLDHLAASARAIVAVNTVVNDHGVLTGHNTDHVAVAALLGRVTPGTRFALPEVRSRGASSTAPFILTTLAWIPCCARKRWVRVG